MYEEDFVYYEEPCLSWKIENWIQDLFRKKGGNVAIVKDSENVVINQAEKGEYHRYQSLAGMGMSQLMHQTITQLPQGKAKDFKYVVGVGWVNKSKRGKPKTDYLLPIRISSMVKDSKFKKEFERYKQLLHNTATMRTSFNFLGNKYVITKEGEGEKLYMLNPAEDEV